MRSSISSTYKWSTSFDQMLPLDATVANKRPQNLLYAVRMSEM